ncbi:hypothetical protein ACFW9O_20335 [Streptomyces sp. NPDC059499]|uniref:hypothetical protein n=1 Tax=Streptomyces sp. NPDC059499 TaxID=3346852 RepID=UPI0036B7898E
MTGQRITARALACAAVVVLSVTSGAVAHADDDIESLPAREIADRSRDALLDTRSLHLHSVGDLGEGRSPMTVDLTLDQDGNCVGGIDLGKDEGSVEIVKRGDTVWVKPDSNFWKNQVPVGGTAFEAILAGRYMKGEASDARLLPMVQVCDLEAFHELLSDNADAPGGTLTKGTGTTVDGVRTVPVTTTGDDQELTLYVATEGKPYPVRITVQDHGADAAVDFSGFDRPVPAATPPAEDAVDVGEVLGGTPAPV